MILIHGSLLDGRSWDDQFGPFARRFRVVRYDARGWGRSALPPRQTYSHHDDLRALMDSLSLERAHILGLSMGGAIAIDFALTYPQRIGALIPVSSGPGGFQAPPPEEPTEKPKRVVDVYRESGLEAAKRHVFQFFKPGVRNLSLLRRMLDDYSGWHLIDEDPGVGPQSPAAQRLDEIGAPALVILGEQDHRNLHLSTDFLKKGVTGARKVVVPGVGHLLNMQQPEQFQRHRPGISGDAAATVISAVARGCFRWTGALSTDVDFWLSGVIMDREFKHIPSCRRE